MRGRRWSPCRRGRARLASTVDTQDAVAAPAWAGAAGRRLQGLTMTDQKKLKQLVRDRMARTGESYTTARRHVLTRAARGATPAPLPPGLVPGYDRFGGGEHRLSTLLAHMLRQAGYAAPHTGEPYSEPMVAGLAGGIGFMYMVFEYTDFPPLMSIVPQHHPDPWLPTALGHLGIPSDAQHSTPTMAAVAALHKALVAGRPVDCELDRTRLAWH